MFDAEMLLNPINVAETRRDHDPVVTIFKGGMCIYLYNHFQPWLLKVAVFYQYVPHKAVAEVSKIGRLQERFVVVSHGWQSKPTDGSKSGWRQRSGVVIVVEIYL